MGYVSVRKFLSILLSLLLLLSVQGCANAVAESEAPEQMTKSEETVEQTTAAESETETAASAGEAPLFLSANEQLVPAYERIDTQPFLDDCDRLAACSDAQEAIELYDALYEQCLQIGTVYEVSYIATSIDVTDAYWTEENLWSESAVMEAVDALCVACGEVLSGPCAEAFRAHLGDAVADALLEYEQANDRINELNEQESALCSEYYAAMSGVDSLAVSYRDEEWTFERWYGEDGDDLYWNDYDAYYDVYDLLMEAIGGVLGPIYVELVTLRREIAEYYGYDNYAEYAYENVYFRDYGLEQAQVFCDQVKRFAPRYYEQVYYNNNAGGYADVQMDGQELVDTLGAYVDRIDPLVEEAWDFLAENELYSLCDSAVCMNGGYTSTIPSTGAPYIYMSLAGGSQDFCVLSHEFGHFVDAWLTPVPNYLVSGANFDLAEIHSNGLEVLYSHYYDDIFGDGASMAEYGLLGEQLNSVVEGCVYDEFQRRVYEAENITLEDVNRIYSEVCVEYGQYDEVYEDSWWVFVGHNFDSPMYYISYAASAIAALQIWEMSRSDYDAAVDVWLSVVREGAYDRGYMEVLSDCGLQSFADEGTVETVVTAALDYLEQIA